MAHDFDKRQLCMFPVKKGRKNMFILLFPGNHFHENQPRSSCQKSKIILRVKIHAPALRKYIWYFQLSPDKHISHGVRVFNGNQFWIKLHFVRYPLSPSSTLAAKIETTFCLPWTFNWNQTNQKCVKSFNEFQN